MDFPSDALWVGVGVVLGAVVSWRLMRARNSFGRSPRWRAVSRAGDKDFKNLFQGNPLPMWLYDVETLDFLAVNRAAVQIYGYSQSEFLTMRITDIRSPEDLPALLHNIKTSDGAWQDSGPWRHLKKDGSALLARVSSHNQDFGGRAARLVVARDVTRQVRLEERRVLLEAQLREAQKMEAVGRLAQGIAHDFNNILGIIMNYAAFLGEDLRARKMPTEDVDAITDASKRAAGLVRQLLTFSRGETARPERLDVNQTVLEMNRLLRRTVDDGVALETRTGDDVRPIVIDPSHLEQVIVNLVVNARDAVGTAGAISITTRNAEVGQEEAARVGLPPGSYVSLEVQDSGSGMDEGTLARVFEPFFTTKSRDGGFGLGLATVYGIVKQAKGDISVVSSRGRGTTFSVLLPVARDNGTALAV